jgi:hypothetical protein
MVGRSKDASSGGHWAFGGSRRSNSLFVALKKGAKDDQIDKKEFDEKKKDLI